MFILSFGIYIRLDSCDLPLNEEKKRNISKPFVEDKFIKKNHIYPLTKKTEKWTLSQDVNSWSSLSVVLGWVDCFLCGPLNHSSWIKINMRETKQRLDVLSFSSCVHQVSSRESSSRSPWWLKPRLLPEETLGWIFVRFVSHKWLITVLISLLFIQPINMFHIGICGA